MAARRFGGRPRREPAPGERVHLGFRITPEMKRKLEAAAEVSGRSLSQEAELRLERTFTEGFLYAPGMGKILAGMVAAFSSTGSYEALAQQGKDPSDASEGPDPSEWVRDPTCYLAAMSAVVGSLVSSAPEDIDWQSHETRSYVVHIVARLASKAGLVAELKNPDDTEYLSRRQELLERLSDIRDIERQVRHQLHSLDQRWSEAARLTNEIAAALDGSKGREDSHNG